VVLLAVTLFVAIFGKAPVVNQQNAVAMLTVITAGSVGIERVIEIFWAVMGLTNKPWWPFTKVGWAAQDANSSLNSTLKAFLSETTKVVGQVEQGAGKVNEQVQKAAADSHQQNLQQLSAELEKLGPDNRRALDVAAAISKSADFFQKTYPQINGAATALQTSAEVASNVLDSFKDNPARRLFSICLGGIIGVISAGALGLDAVQATLGTPVPYVIGCFPNAGTAITGVVIGLGASPTHEIIKTLQETKQNQKSS
jgi:hypothetical protein